MDENEKAKIRHYLGGLLYIILGSIFLAYALNELFIHLKMDKPLETALYITGGLVCLVIGAEKLTKT